MISIPKPKRERDEGYLNWIRRLPCLLSRQQFEGRAICNGKIDPHHVIPDGGGKVGSKVDDKRAVPLCRDHHGMAQKGRDLFQSVYDIDLEAEIRYLNSMYHPKPTVKRKSGLKVQVRVEGCPCNRAHTLSWSKVPIVRNVFTCPLSLKRTEVPK
jgi:hypothetical protein